MNPLNPLADTPANRQLWSLARVCELLQLSPAEVDALREAAGVDYAVTINEVAYLSGDGLQRLYEERRSAAKSQSQGAAVDA